MTTDVSTELTWCPFCGQELPGGAIRCSRCSHWLPALSGAGGTAKEKAPLAAAAGEDERPASETSPPKETVDEHKKPVTLPSLSEALAAFTALGAIGAPLYFLGLWSLRQRIQDIHNLDFWTAWYVANQVPRSVIVVNGLSILVSPSILVFAGVLLLTALVQQLQEWLEDEEEDVLAGVQRLFVWMRGLTRWAFHPRMWLRLACVGAIVVGSVNDLLEPRVSSTLLILALNAVVVIAFLAFYLEYALARETWQHIIYLVIAAPFVYLFLVPLIYYLQGKLPPPLWSMILAAAGTALGAWLMAGLAQHDFHFSVRLVALFLLAYLPALVPSYTWKDRHASLDDLPLPHVVLCVGTRDTRSKAPPVPVTGELVTSGSGNVTILPDKPVMRQGRLELVPGNMVVTFDSRIVEMEVAATTARVPCTPRKLG